MTDAQKRTMGLISWIPLLAFTIGTIYFMYVNGRLIDNKMFHKGDQVVLFAFRNYDQLLLLGAVAGTISLAVMLYFIVHLAKLKNVNDGMKIGWIMFMVFFGAFSFPIFYNRVIKNEPEDQPMHNSLEDAKG